MSENLLQKIYFLAHEELKDLPVTIDTKHRCYSKDGTIIYLKPIQLKGNKFLLEKLTSMGWVPCGRHTLQKRKIILLSKKY